MLTPTVWLIERMFATRSLYSGVMHVTGLDHIVLNVADVERSLAWYVDVIGLAPVRVDLWREGKSPFPSVRVNEDTIIDLVRAPRIGVNMDHLCLVVDRADVEAVIADEQFTVIAGPGSRYGARGDGWSVYVRDPDGNTVEFRAY